jgi:hypothetical protein
MYSHREYCEADISPETADHAILLAHRVLTSFLRDNPSGGKAGAGSDIEK